jgi:hypothetical protein
MSRDVVGIKESERLPRHGLASGGLVAEFRKIG